MPMTPSSRKEVSCEINVTPLIDVLLVMLIIFMIMPHHRGEMAEVPLPGKTPPVEVEETIVVELRSRLDGSAPEILINRNRVAWEALSTRLEEVYSNRANKVAFLKGDPEIQFQHVADVLDTIRHAGVVQVALLDSSAR